MSMTAVRESVVNLIPIRFSLRDKPTGKRREDDAVDLLQCKLIGAKLLIAGLRLQLDDKDAEHEATIARIDERHAEAIRGLERQLRDLQWRLDIATRANAAADMTQEMPAIPQPAPTVRTLQQAHCIGPSLDPGRTH